MMLKRYLLVSLHNHFYLQLLFVHFYHNLLKLIILRKSIEPDTYRVLSEFQHRQQNVRPGDALKCMVAVDMRYGFDNELISETYVVTEVLEVLENNSDQADLFKL